MNVPTPPARLVGVGYLGLIAVNVLASTRLFGLRTNAELSDAYPTNITPAGFTFSIWGPIFLLQGIGTGMFVFGGASTRSFTAVGTPWLATWLFECLWQFVFFTLPVPRESASEGRRLLTLVPSMVMLLSGYGSMLFGGVRLRLADASSESSGMMSEIASAFFVGLPTGLNAGWLAAASGIGITLVCQDAAPSVATANGGAALVTVVASLGAVLALGLGSSTRSVTAGIGYALATSWACFGITRGDNVPSAVEAAAGRGIWIAAAGGLLGAAAAVGSHFLNGSGSDSSKGSQQDLCKNLAQSWGNKSLDLDQQEKLYGSTASREDPNKAK